jgi:hypothetical protein
MLMGRWMEFRSTEAGPLGLSRQLLIGVLMAEHVEEERV